MANPFSSFLGSFKKKSGSVLGIDIGSSAIKVVQLRKQGPERILETYGELSLGPYASSEIGQATNLAQDKIIAALKDILKEANTTTKDSALAIAAGASLLSFIKMPDVPQKQLATMIPIEARKYIPVPIAEVSLDWWPIPKDEETVSDFEAPDASKSPDDKMIEILLVVIHNETIDSTKEIAAATNLDLSFFEIEIFSSMRSVVEADARLGDDFRHGRRLDKTFHHRSRYFAFLSHHQPRQPRDHAHTLSIARTLRCRRRTLQTRDGNFSRRQKQKRERYHHAHARLCFLRNQQSHFQLPKEIQ